MRERGERDGYVFKAGPGSVSGYRHTFRKAFQRAVVRAGLDPAFVTPHVLRHTAITKLVKAGVDLPTVQKVSGHKTLSMVLRYSHVDGAHIDTAINHLALPNPNQDRLGPESPG
jgi:site-specific recombinase XerD